MTLDISAKDELLGVKILTDEEEENPILDFEDYADSIVKIVKGSIPNFSVGIYGDWGTGKSTLMRLIEKKFENHVKDIVVSWDELAEKNSASSEKLRSFLLNNYSVEWIRDVYFSRDKDNSSKISISNDNDTINSQVRHNNNNNTYLPSFLWTIRRFISSENNKNEESNKTHVLSIGLDDEKSKAVLTIDNIEKDKFQITKDSGKTRIHLKEKEVLTIWFNAWRYEREEHYALIALMKTIAYAMADLGRYQEIKRVLLRGLGIITKNIMRNLAAKYVMTEKGFEELERTLLPKMELLSKVDKDTIYFDGLLKIEQEMKSISTRNGNNIIVVFIDDLDRCSPTTALEVFESIKVFLGMRGFVYIIGLSNKTISKLISARFKEAEIKGEDYIRKIIQIPVTIPEWNDIDIRENLIPSLATKLDDTYKEIIENNKELISTAVKLNPREVKLFINNFIVAHEIYSKNDQVQAKELLVVQALRVRWNNFYQYLISDDDKFRNEIKKYAIMPEDERNKVINERKDNKDKPPKYYENEIFKIQAENELWDFLFTNKDILFNIEDWKVYRRAAETVKKNPAEDNPWLRNALKDLIEYGENVALELRKYVTKVHYLSPIRVLVGSFHYELTKIKDMYIINPTVGDPDTVDRLGDISVKIHNALRSSDRSEEEDVSHLLTRLTEMRNLASRILL